MRAPSGIGFGHLNGGINVILRLVFVEQLYPPILEDRLVGKLIITVIEYINQKMTTNYKYNLDIKGKRKKQEKGGLEKMG